MSTLRPDREPESIYTEFDISDHLERQRDVSRFDRSDPATEEIAQLDELLDDATEVLAQRYSVVTEATV